jgi:hypothetical protein
MDNFIQGANPFKLAGPPTYWLAKLWDFDPSLVVIPSVQGFHYRICQRRPLDEKAKLVNDVSREGDSLMLAQYGLVPVTTLLATARWDNPLMWNDLAERAPWRQGGADAYIKKVEGAEAEKQLKINLENSERNTALAKDAWKMYQIRTGTRLGLTGSNKVTPNERPASASAALKIVDAYGRPTYRI